jgi:hypothetical protein
MVELRSHGEEASWEVARAEKRRDTLNLVGREKKSNGFSERSRKNNIHAFSDFDKSSSV